MKLSILNDPIKGKPWCNLGKFFLDSGAYSVFHSGSEELDPINYAHYVFPRLENFNIIAAPDKIGNATLLDNFNLYRDFTNTLETIGEWDDIAHKIAYVYHLGDEDNDMSMDELLEELHDDGIGWIAIGGAAGSRNSKSERLQIMARTIRQIRHKTNIKVHLLGCFSPEFVKVLKPDAIDSAAYMSSGKNLAVKKYTKDWKLHLYMYPKPNDERMTVFKKELQWLHSIGLLPETPSFFMHHYRNMPDSDPAKIQNALFFAAFEHFVRDAFRNEFIAYMTLYDSNRICRMGSKIVEHIFGGRTLISFADGENGTDAKLRKYRNFSIKKKGRK